jgi:ABC-type phosphate/phosphonate transport system substrate-binding protein
VKVRRTIATLALLGLTAVVSPAGAADAAAPAQPTRTLAVIPFYSPERMWQLYTPFIDHLRRATGERWELKLYPNHDALIAGVCAGAVDITLLGPVPLGRVNRACGVLPFLVPRGRDGKPAYHSMLLASDPAVTTVAGLRGKKVGFFKGSTAAHIVPLQMLRDAGLGPGEFEPVFFESQDRIMTALLSHEVAGAGVKETLYRRFEKEPLRLLQTSAALPNFAFAALPSQSPALRERFVGALLTMEPLADAAAAATVKGWDDEIKNGFVAPAPDFLPAVLRVYDIYETVMHESR